MPPHTAACCCGGTNSRLTWFISDAQSRVAPSSFSPGHEKKKYLKRLNTPQIHSRSVKYYWLWIVVWFGIFGLLCVILIRWSRLNEGNLLCVRHNHLVQRPSECDLKKHSPPRLNPIQQYYIISVYISWTSSMGKLYTWIISRPLVCTFLCRIFYFKISVVGSAVSDDPECRFYSAASPKMSFFLRSISAKSNSVPVILW